MIITYLDLVAWNLTRFSLFTGEHCYIDDSIVFFTVRIFSTQQLITVYYITASIRTGLLNLYCIPLYFHTTECAEHYTILYYVQSSAKYFCGQNMEYEC